MATLSPDAFDVTSIGKQFNSKRDTEPAYSFGTGSREAAVKKVFISAKHEKLKAPITSPGPVYDVPSTVGASPKWSFGCDDQRKHPKAKYPDSSVDLTRAPVESQGLKFHSTKAVHFGTESKSCYKNCEIVRVSPSITLGLESPGALEYEPEKSEPHCIKSAPHYSFGPSPKEKDKKEKVDKNAPVKPVTRLHIPPTATPRHVGPGSHLQPPGLGQQPHSARTSAPAYSFGSSPRQQELKYGPQLLEISPELSSLGKQVISNQRTAPRAAFGGATREGAAKMQVVTCAADRGPAAVMPKPNHVIDLPRVPVRLPGKAGM